MFYALVLRNGIYSLQDTKADGATLLTGGKRPGHVPRGYFVEPTVFTNVKPEMRLWREEVFGPVLASATFRTEDEAIAVANASQYGLAAAVISADEERCKRVAAAMETGIVWINCSQPCFCQVGHISFFPISTCYNLQLSVEAHYASLHDCFLS